MIAEMALGLILSMPPKAKPELPARCTDRIAKMLWRVGFRGEKNKIAWAITWRESHHQNLGSDSPYFSGAYGIWQVQESAHSGKPWYSRDAMLNPERQSRIVYKYMSNRGRSWQPWGLNQDGTGMDTTAYGGWSSSQHYAWIWAPYMKGRALYPNGCAR